MKKLKTDMRRLDAMSDEDIARAVAEDPDAAPLLEDPKSLKNARRRGPQKSPTKIMMSLRLSPEVVEYFRTTGKGWQTRVDQILREYIEAHK